MSTTPENDPGLLNCLVGFNPDLELFEYHIHLWHVHYVSTLDGANAWTAFPNFADFLIYCKKCLRLYIHLSFSERFGLSGFRSDSPRKLGLSAGEVFLPEVILDIIREVARPMYTNAGIEVQAYLPLDCTDGNGACPGLGWNTRERAISSVISAITNCTVKRVLAENVGRAPIFVASGSRIAWANGSTVPPFRLYSMSYLRHLRPVTQWILGWSAANTASVPTTPYVVPRIQTLDVTYPPPPVEVDWSHPLVFEENAPQFADAAGVTHVFTTVIRQYEELCHLLPRVEATIGGNPIEIPQPAVPIEEFQTGALGAERLVSFLRSMTLSDEHLYDQGALRAVFNLGNSFVRDSYPVQFTVPRGRFPSTEFPSKEGLAGSAAPPGEPKKPRSRKKAAPAGERPA